MQRFSNAVSTFEHAIDRSQQMISLYDALVAIRPNEPANDDALRSAYILAVSSFDFFVHEVAAIETKDRFINGKKTRRICLPMEVITITDQERRTEYAEGHIRQSNGYKAFVDPDKLAELLSCYCTEPWTKLAALINGGLPAGDQQTVKALKERLRLIWKRRNQIAHEADVNPTLAGVSLWPICKEDTGMTIEFISTLGRHLTAVISETLPDED